MKNRLLEIKNKKEYNLEESISIICQIQKITKEELGNMLDLQDIEAVYEYAYANQIYLNEIKWQEYKDIDNINNMFLVHGSKSGLVGNIRLDFSDSNNDFGSGFYCGTTLKQAGMFVCNEPNSSLYVISFKPQGLKAARFRVDTDWMLAVAYYRGTIDKYKEHERIKSIINRINKCDYIIAPIADNRIFATIDSFTNGEITDAQCLHALSATHLGYQYVFKKNKTLLHLDVIDHMYLCDSEKSVYNIQNNIESNTSLNKAILSKKKYENEGLYINDLLK